MNLHFIDAYSLDELWFMAIKKVVEQGRKYLITSGSYEGINRSSISAVLRVRYPATRPLEPTLAPGSGIASPASSTQIEDYLLYLMTNTKSPNEHYTYGEDLHWEVPWVIKHYKEKGFGTAHCYMTVGRPESLYFYDKETSYSEHIYCYDSKKPVTDPPKSIRHVSNDFTQKETGSSQCLRGIDTWVEDGNLNFWCYFRSWDLWGGFPSNLAAIQILKEYMAGEIGVEDGEIIASSKGLHIYKYVWELAKLRRG